MKVTTPQGEMTVDGDKGTFTSKDDKGNEFTAGGQVTEADIGVPFYPGSKEKPNSSFTATENGRKSVLCVRTTPDDPEKVIAFYKDKLKDATTGTSSVGEMKTSSLTGKLNGGDFTITAVKQGAADTDISIGYRAAK
jgi:hypothetical protein